MKNIGDLKLNQIYNMDCLEGMKLLPDASIDCIICDLPYGTTACKWDTIIPLQDFIEVGKKRCSLENYLIYAYQHGIAYNQAMEYFDKHKQQGLWSEYKRLIKTNGAIVLFGSEPFSTALRQSNMEMYKYDWIWKKNTVDGFFNAKCRPLKTIENIMVFSKAQARAKGDNMIYYPQGLVEINKALKDTRKAGAGDEHQYYRDSTNNREYTQIYTNYPIEILEFARDKEKLHPTQKPVVLLEYLINTYTKPNEIILDNCMGSGSTAIAAINTGRSFIGFETNTKYYTQSLQRIEGVKK